MVVDTHSHIFELGRPLAAVRRYAPSYDARVEDYLAVLDANGVSHGVLVQPSFYGTDNAFLLEALRRYPERLRGIAVIDLDIGDAELEALAAAGVVGIRLNLQALPLPDFGADGWPGLLPRLQALDWQVEVHREACDLPAVVDPLLAAGLNVVLDHFGRPDGQLGADDPGFRYVLDARRSGRIYVELSASYRNWNGDTRRTGARRCADLLLEHLGADHLVWGSDWPHTQKEHLVDFPGVRAELDEWVDAWIDRETILSDTPRRLFRFD